MTNAEKRRDARIAMTHPIKVQCTQTGRYYTGITSNYSAGGALLEVAHPSLMVPGQRVKIGIAWNKRQAVLPAETMAEATVVRSLGLGATQRVALRFDHRQELAATG